MTTVQRWHEADSVFTSGSRWCGSDGAYSTPISGGRVLWLFGDTFVKGDDDSRSIVASTIGVMDGTDPSRSRIDFWWSHPSGTFDRAEGERWWPSGVVTLTSGPLVFTMRATAPDGAIRLREWAAAAASNSHGPADQWTWTPLQTPDLPEYLICGPGTFVERPHLYCFASDVRGLEGFTYGVSPDVSLPACLVRWDLQDADAGDLHRIQWWDGQRWTSAGEPASVVDGVPVEFTVHKTSDGWMLVQGVGLFGAQLAVRTAPTPTGPWSSPKLLFAPPEGVRDDVCLYAFKAHPHLRGPGLVLTYATNATTLQGVVNEPDLYRPRFLVMDTQSTDMVAT